MITLLKGLDCYCPKHIGIKDVLIIGDKIGKIADSIEDNKLMDSIMSCKGWMAFPGIIDQHVHIIGGGGEDGYESRIPEIDFQDIVSAGVTTAVGLLGADSQTKSLRSLLAKVRALEQQGLTAYMYSGSYTIPPVTLTGDITGDMVLIDKVLGIGEIAMSDHRSSYPDAKALLSIASQAHLGGMVSKKAGVVHLHVGDGKAGIQPLFEIYQTADLPMEVCIPTHVNRNPYLFQHAMEYHSLGGHIDLTAGETEGISVPEAVRKIEEKSTDTSRVTVSSDANGNLGNGKVGQIKSLFQDIVNTVVLNQCSPERIFPLVTENPAKNLKLYPQKGTLQTGSDADILITDSYYQIKKVFCRGKLQIDKGKNS